VGSGVAGGQAAQAIERAQSKLGARYVLATAGPETFDCSGFTWWVAQPILGPLDYELRSSHHQFNVWGERLRERDPQPLRPGDLLFFDSMGVSVFGNRASHVGLYLGDWQMIHAANEDDGVIISRPFEGWYAPRYIGARRIFDLGAPMVVETPAQLPGPSVHEAPETGHALRLLAGPIVTRNQWNGDHFPVGWERVAAYAATIGWAAEESRVDARIVAALGLMETQFTQSRDGDVLRVADGFPEDGPSVGVMQVKPKVWQWLRPDLDPNVIGDNIRLGAAVIAHLIAAEDGDVSAAVRRWYPGKDIERYLATFWGLMGEMGDAS
jgi:hypothetical protein